MAELELRFHKPTSRLTNLTSIQKINNQNNELVSNQSFGSIPVRDRAFINSPSNKKIDGDKD